MGGKASDLYTVPLCAEHHRGSCGVHTVGERAFWSWNVIDPKKVMLELINKYLSCGGKL